MAVADLFLVVCAITALRLRCLLMGAVSGGACHCETRGTAQFRVEHGFSAVRPATTRLSRGGPDLALVRRRGIAHVVSPPHRLGRHVQPKTGKVSKHEKPRIPGRRAGGRHRAYRWPCAREHVPSGKPNVPYHDAGRWLLRVYLARRHQGWHGGVNATTACTRQRERRRLRRTPGRARLPLGAPAQGSTHPSPAC